MRDVEQDSAVTTLLLVDLSGLFWAAWYAGAGKEPSFPYEHTVGRVRSLVGRYDYAAVCCDSGRTFRHDLDPAREVDGKVIGYKANRPDRDPVAIEQLRRVKDTLRADGMVLWEAPGFEADDVIASAAAWAVGHGGAPPGIDGAQVTVASNDKDALALVAEDVRVLSLTTGATLGPAEVKAKLGVGPELVRDFLAMVGDTSDHVVGVKGCGKGKAPALLEEFGSLVGIISALEVPEESAKLKPAMLAAFRDFAKGTPGERPVDLAVQLVTLRRDVPLPFGDLFKPRDQKPLPTPGWTAPTDDEDEEPMSDETPETTADPTPEVLERVRQKLDAAEAYAGDVPRGAPPVVEATPEPARAAPTMPAAPMSTALATVLSPDDPRYAVALEPRSPREAMMLAESMFQSRLFGLASPQATLAAILLGRSLGIGAVSICRNVHVIESKLALHADLIAGLVLKSGKASIYKCIETSATRCVYKAHRKDDPDPEPTFVTWTIEMARTAKLVRDGGNWTKNPTAMLVARAKTACARLVFPDVTAGLYSPDELGSEADFEPIAEAS